MSEHGPLIIVGTGLAGYTLAREWRKLDRERSLIMLTEDDGAFYSKPMLSNALAQGKSAEDLASKSAAKMAADLDADIRTGVHVQSINTATNTLVVDGDSLKFGDLVLAVGAQPIPVPVPGAGRDDLVAVNSLSDYRQFRERLATVSRVAIMGPGLIGCEFANDLAGSGKQVDVFGPDPWPLSTLLPKPSGEALGKALEMAGIHFHLGATARRMEKIEDRYLIELDNGTKIEADLVLSAVGLRPDTSLAAAAGLEIERGIVTDRMMQTSADRIFALGDCAEVEGLNLPYVMPIMHGARALAKTLAGEPTAVSYPAMPVVIKTPALATVVSPPPAHARGDWQIEGDESDIRATFISDDGRMLGFALTGEAATEKQALSRQLPAVL